MTVSFGLISLFALRSAEQFNTATDRIVVDFPAFHFDGRSLKPLTPDDLLLRIDGRERAISSLDLVRIDSTGSQSRPTKSANPAITVPFLGRSILLVVDQESIWPGAEKQALKAASRFIDGLSSADDVSLVSLPDGSSRNSVSKADIQRALPLLVGRAPLDRDECDAAPISRDTLRQLATFLRSRKRIDRPTVLIFISGGLLPPASGAEPRIRRSTCAALRPTTTDFAELGKLAVDLRLQLFVIQPDVFSDDVSRRAPPNRAKSDELLFGLETVVGAMDGQLFRISGTADSAFERIERESTAYYLLSFEPSAKERDGAAHKIELRLKRSNERLRARRTFTIPPANSR